MKPRIDLVRSQHTVSVIEEKEYIHCVKFHSVFFHFTSYQLSLPLDSDLMRKFSFLHTVLCEKILSWQVARACTVFYWKLPSTLLRSRDFYSKAFLSYRKEFKGTGHVRWMTPLTFEVVGQKYVKALWTICLKLEIFRQKMSTGTLRICCDDNHYRRYRRFFMLCLPRYLSLATYFALEILTERPRRYINCADDSNGKVLVL